MESAAFLHLLPLETVGGDLFQIETNPTTDQSRNALALAKRRDPSRIVDSATSYGTLILMRACPILIGSTLSSGSALIALGLVQACAPTSDHLGSVLDSGGLDSSTHLAVDGANPGDSARFLDDSGAAERVSPEAGVGLPAAEAGTVARPGTLVWAVDANATPRGYYWKHIAGIDDRALYILGTNYEGPSAAWRLEKRSLSDGALVQSFGQGGVLIMDPTSEEDTPMDMAVGGGALYLLGQPNVPNSVRIEKRNTSDGSLVTTFGVGGAIEYQPRDSWYDDRRIVLRPDAFYVSTMGGSVSGSLGSMVVTKYDLETGSTIDAFGNHGSTVLSIYYGLTMLARAADDDAVYWAGMERRSPENRWAIAKVDATNGDVSSTFATVEPGVVEEMVPGLQTILWDMAVANRAVYVVGWVDEQEDGRSVKVSRIEKRATDTGALDPAFGVEGAALSRSTECRSI